ncbi:hypothetical protein BFJ70_g17050 [Fusarium oxysporum]|nr:hypothetical protein BFJ70_g17050 [Fusarium oxysporum]
MQIYSQTWCLRKVTAGPLGSAKPVRIFYWTCEAGGLPDFPDRPFALLCVESENRMEDRIEDHFLENPRRWNRLTHSLHWLVVDVFFIFNKWDGVIEATAEALTTMVRSFSATSYIMVDSGIGLMMQY